MDKYQVKINPRAIRELNSIREENAGKVQNYKRSRRPRISDRRIRSVSQRHLEENILFPDRNPVILPRLLFRPSVRVSDARLRRGLRW